jgi:hypothetical protein
MEIYCKRVHILLILTRKLSKSRMNPLDVRWRWANWFTDLSLKNYTALEAMDLGGRTLRPLWGPTSHGMSSREAMLHSLEAQSQDKVRKSS